MFDRCSLFYVFQAGRGHTYDIVYVDEAGFVKTLTHLLPYVNRRGTKLVLTSSMNTAADKTCSLLKLERTGAAYYRVCFSCPGDVPRVAESPEAIACHHYIMSLPPHITTDVVQKTVMNTLEPNSYETENMGVTLGGEDGHPGGCCGYSLSMFSRSVVREMREGQSDLDTFNNLKCLGDTLFLYVDPAYTTNSSVSASGIACVCRFTPAPPRPAGALRSGPSSKTRRMAVVLGVDEVRLIDHSVPAHVFIGLAVLRLLQQVVNVHACPRTHSSRFKAAVIAVESNSNEHMAVQICQFVNAAASKTAGPLHTLSLKFTHRRRTDKDAKSVGLRSVREFGTAEVAGFFLDRQKKTLVGLFQMAFNSRVVRLSMNLVSPTLEHSGQDPRALIADQLSKFRADAKPQDNTQDDVAIALILAYNLLLNERNDGFNVHALVPVHR